MSHRFHFPAATHATLGTLLALLAAQPALALLRFNDGRDQVYVTAYIAAGYDSNIYTTADAVADFTISSGAGIEYARKAGLIGVNAALNWDFTSFVENSDENSLNPSASLEFSKGTGRTTGAIQFNAQRDSRADPTIGLRTESWDYGVNLNLRYPVIERYTIAANIGWAHIDYVDDTNTLSDLSTYTIGTDLFYSWRSDRDLLAGYRYRIGDAQFDSTSTDHSVYVGVAGRIVSKLSGTARIGVTHHTVNYPGDIPESSDNGFYASVSGTWPASQKASFTLTLTEDFDTTASNFQTRATTAELLGQFSHTVKFSTSANLGGGFTEYISGYGAGSSAPTQGFNGRDRDDHYLSAGVGAAYSFNNHFTLSANYDYFRNWSNLSDFEFARHTFTVTLSTRW
jgi:hypothetical protein